MKRLLCLALLFGAMPTAHAQSVPTEAQVNAYKEGLVAFQDEDWSRAMQLLQEAVNQGEFDLFQLTLGRAFYKAGYCDAAHASYERALAAPHIGNPPHSEIEGRVRDYQLELAEGCPGQLVVECSPDSMQVSIDGGPDGACPPLPVALDPGTHVVVGTWRDQTVSHEVTLVGQQLFQQKLTIIPPPPPVGEIMMLSGTGLVALSLATDALVLGGTIKAFRSAADEPDGNAERLFKSARTMQTVLIGTYAVGGVVAGAGLVVFLGKNKPATVAVRPGLPAPM